MGAGPRALCLKCGDIIQSRHRHDFVWCKCKSVAIDGGSDYTKMCGNQEDWRILKEGEDPKLMTKWDTPIKESKDDS